MYRHHIKRITLPARDVELARRFFRRCRELFGDGCTAAVRKRCSRPLQPNIVNWKSKR
jgi:hypothetical protein